MKLFVIAVGLRILMIAVGPGEQVYHRKGETLTVINQDSTLETGVIKQLVDTFFKVYPREKKDFNPHAIDIVHVRIDTSYSGVAYTSGDHIVINAKWLHRKPHDTDLLTHEVMHIIQSYPGHSGPGWLTEGIADYVRYKYGVDNASAGWSLTPFSRDQNYTNSYRVTARFLVWNTRHYDKDLVKKMDAHLRNDNYSPKLWKKYTGHSVKKLWKIYSKDPKL